MKLHYHIVLDSVKKEDALYAQLVTAGTWLWNTLGEAEKTLELNDSSLTEDQRLIDNDLLFDKMYELLGEESRVVSLMTWSKGPGYEALALTSTIADDNYELDHHDLVVMLDDDLHAVQFKLVVG